MENVRPPIVPPNDISDFYNNMLKASLQFIYNCHDELQNNRLLIQNINYTLDKIYIQIKNRLRRYNFKKQLILFYKINITLKKLKPFCITAKLDNETGERYMAKIPSKEYSKYYRYVIEKECLMWECLDLLGILGRLKEGSEERVT